MANDVYLNAQNLSEEVTGLTEGGSYHLFSLRPAGVVLVEAEVEAGTYEEIFKGNLLNHIIPILPGTKLRLSVNQPGSTSAKVRITAKV